MASDWRHPRWIELLVASLLMRLTEQPYHLRDLRVRSGDKHQISEKNLLMISVLLSLNALPHVH